MLKNTKNGVTDNTLFQSKRSVNVCEVEIKILSKDKSARHFFHVTRNERCN